MIIISQLLLSFNIVLFSILTLGAAFREEDLKCFKRHSLTDTKFGT